MTQAPEIAGSFLERTVVEVGGIIGHRGRFEEQGRHRAVPYPPRADRGRFAAGPRRQGAKSTRSWMSAGLTAIALGLAWSDSRLGGQAADGGPVHPKEPREISRTLPA